jgi:hypothetical protein
VQFAPATVGAKNATVTVSSPTGGAATSVLARSASWISQDLGAPGPGGRRELLQRLFHHGRRRGHLGRQRLLPLRLRQRHGQPSVTARVTSAQNVAMWTKAAVMMRDGFAAKAANVTALVCSTIGNLYRLQVRNARQRADDQYRGRDRRIPAWLRLVRLNNTFTAFFSADGISWTPLGAPAPVTMSATIEIGMAVTSPLDGTPATAKFDNVTIAQP